MSQFVRRAAALVALLVTAACAERNSPLEPRATTPPGAPAAAQAASDEQGRHERLARAFALALQDAEFRATVLKALQQSRHREGKIHLQQFLGSDGGRLRHRLAELAKSVEAELSADLDRSTPLELYLPVPAHRKAWHGDGNLLVATAEADHAVPVAFDTRGNRQLLDPDRPPNVPVIALERAELDFGAVQRPSATEVYDEDPNGGGGSGGSWDGSGGLNGSVTSTPGLYMTYAKFNSTFEGWLKGAPEFEVHILGQDGSTNSMKSYQCAGEQAGIPYSFNQDDTEWSGNVVLFSQTQLDAYKAEHPGQALRILILEDDDGPCVIKTDSARFARMVSLIVANYGQLTGGRDTLISIKTFRKAQTLLAILKSVWSWLTTQDDVVGIAIEDAVAREYFPGANWIVKGENTATQGAIRLEMR
jgi:hypothetical protein